MKDRFVAKRLINVVLIFLVTMGYTAAICLYRGLWVDETVAVFFVSLIFYALFLFVLEHNRAKKRISGNRETSFFKVTAGFAASALLMFFGALLPEFFRLSIAAAILMVSLSSVELSLCTGIFLDVILCLGLGLGVQELICCCLLTLFGCMIAEAMENSSFTFWYNMVILCLCVLLPGIFYYLTYQEVKMNLFLYGAIEGIVIDYLMLLFHKRVVRFRAREVARLLDDMLSGDYPLAKELESFSKPEYEHAKRVSALAGRCATAIGADEKVCAAAGLYYRIGIMEGEPLAETGTRIAQKACLPEEVIRIISECNGELALPSSAESAIVHMVDGLIKKMEVFDRRTMSSEWNQDMVIYQTLNDFSAEGLYDKSGLSMNMFLKIREFLVKEEALL